MREIGRMMVFAGAALAAIGALVWLAARPGGLPLRLGRLPGDIAYQGKHLDEAGINEIRFAKTPAEAVDIALSLAPSAETGKAVEREFRS